MSRSKAECAKIALKELENFLGPEGVNEEINKWYPWEPAMSEILGKKGVTLTEMQRHSLVFKDTGHFFIDVPLVKEAAAEFKAGGRSHSLSPAVEEVPGSPMTGDIMDGYI